VIWLLLTSFLTLRAWINNIISGKLHSLSQFLTLLSPKFSPELFTSFNHQLCSHISTSFFIFRHRQSHIPFQSLSNRVNLLIKPAKLFCNSSLSTNEDVLQIDFPEGFDIYLKKWGGSISGVANINGIRKRNNFLSQADPFFYEISATQLRGNRVIIRIPKPYLR